MSGLFDPARQIADAVLYEGYILYPYRASAGKNQLRWQFGVVAPRGWSEAGGCEQSWMQAECLIEPGGRTSLVGRVRALQLQRRSVEEAIDPAGVWFKPTDSLESEGELWVGWDEGVEREIEFFAGAIHPGTHCSAPFALNGGRDIEPLLARSGRPVGRLIRERLPVRGEVHVSVDRATDAGVPLLRLRVRVDNLSPSPAPGAPRDDALRSSLVGTHILLALGDGAFVSLFDPPEWARRAASACANVRSWPVLAGLPGDRSMVLAAPIILHDHPQIAPESPATFCDSTEIDELLALRTMTLTDREKREARATDARAAAIVDRVDAMAPEVLQQLHGAVRSLRPLAGPEPAVRGASGVPPTGSWWDPTGVPPDAPGSGSRQAVRWWRPTGVPPDAPGSGSRQAVRWWDPGADESVAPETDSVEIDGVSVARGSRVRLRPGSRRTDAQDMFLVGRVASVQGVFLDVEERRYIAVTLADDPGADLKLAHGRYLYFYPDEVEPLVEGG